MCFPGLALIVSFPLQAPAHRPAPTHPVWPVAPGDELSSRRSSPSRPDSPALPDPVGDPLPPVTTKRNKVVLDLHSRLSHYFPSHFHQNLVDVPYYEDQPPEASHLILDPDLSRSWFRPASSVPSDTVGYWAPVPGCKLPPNRSHLFPPSAKGRPLARAPYYYVADDSLRAKFKAPTLQSVSLNLQVFDKGEVSVGSSPLALLEAHLRASLLECWTTDAYLQIVHELSMCAVGLFDSVPQAETLELLPEVVRQTAMANARSGQSLGAGYVGNVVALRDVVLDRFRAEERTLNTLRGGDFTGPSLFGPLPESFASLLDTPQGSKLRCSSKAPGSRAPPSRPPAPVVPSPVSGFKRPGPSVGPSSGAKRPKPAAAQSGRNPPFPKKPAGRGKYGRS